MSDFAHLHIHTTFSALDGVATPDEYFEICEKRGYGAIAITEHGNMASVPSNYWASQKTCVKYISGCEVYYNDWEKYRQEELDGKIKLNELDDNIRNKIYKHRHLTVLTKNMIGYQKLI